jgi:hypothetical protein
MGGSEEDGYFHSIFCLVRTLGQILLGSRLKDKSGKLQVTEQIINRLASLDVCVCISRCNENTEYGDILRVVNSETAILYLACTH